MNVSGVAKNMIRTICIAVLAVIAAGALYYRSLAAGGFALGALLGGALNIYKIIALERTIEKALTMESGRAAGYIRVQYLLRFLLTGIVLAAAAILPFLNLWGATAGVFTLPIAAFCTKFYYDREGDSDGKNVERGTDAPV